MISSPRETSRLGPAEVGFLLDKRSGGQSMTSGVPMPVVAKMIRQRIPSRLEGASHVSDIEMTSAQSCDKLAVHAILDRAIITHP